MTATAEKRPVGRPRKIQENNPVSSAEPAPTIQPTPAVTGTATVTVACKLLHGLDCRIFAPRTISEPVLGGGTRQVTQNFATGKGFKVRGPAHGQNEGPRSRLVGGFAITEGIPKALWDAWYEQHKELPFVANGMIFAFERDGMVTGKARELRGLKTGQERLDPEKLPQFESPFSVKTADEQKAKPQSSNIE